MIEKAAYIYRKADEHGLIHGRSTPAMIAACVYAACKDAETPKTLNDVSAISSITRKDLARCYRLLCTELDLRVAVVDPSKCITRIAGNAAIKESTKRRALEILKRADEVRMLSGKDPMGLAAAAVYGACVLENDIRTLREVAEAASVTEVTVRNRYKELKTTLNI